MPWIRFVVIFEPFLQLSVLADLQLRQAVARGDNLFAKGFINAKKLTRFNHPRKQRVQNFAVHRRSHHKLANRLIEEFGRQTGVPLLLNTSFNENEPIVMTPAEALDTFQKTKMDVLVLGNYVLRRNGDA